MNIRVLIVLAALLLTGVVAPPKNKARSGTPSSSSDRSRSNSQDRSPPNTPGSSSSGSSSSSSSSGGSGGGGGGGTPITPDQAARSAENRLAALQRRANKKAKTELNREKLKLAASKRARIKKPTPEKPIRGSCIEERSNTQVVKLDEQGYGSVTLGSTLKTKTLQLKPKLTKFQHLKGTSNIDQPARYCIRFVGNNGKLFYSYEGTEDLEYCPQEWADGPWTHYERDSKERHHERHEVWEPNYITVGVNNYAAAHVKIKIVTGIGKAGRPTWKELPGKWLVPVSGFTNRYGTMFFNKYRYRLVDKEWEQKGFVIQPHVASSYDRAWHTLRKDLTGNKAVTAIQTQLTPNIIYPAYLNEACKDSRSRGRSRSLPDIHSDNTQSCTKRSSRSASLPRKLPAQSSSSSGSSSGGGSSGGGTTAAAAAAGGGGGGGGSGTQMTPEQCPSGNKRNDECKKRKHSGNQEEQKQQSPNAGSSRSRSRSPRDRTPKMD